MSREFYNYADERRIVIREKAEDPDDTSFVHILAFSSEIIEQNDTIPDALMEFLHDKEGYSFSEQRSHYEHGASGSAQDIAIAVTAVLSADLIRYAFLKAKEWIGSGKADSLSLDSVELVEDVKGHILDHFKPYGTLTLIEQHTEPSIRLVFKDSADTFFTATIDSITHGISITRGSS